MSRDLLPLDALQTVFDFGKKDVPQGVGRPPFYTQVRHGDFLRICNEHRPEGKEARHQYNAQVIEEFVRQYAEDFPDWTDKKLRGVSVSAGVQQIVLTTQKKLQDHIKNKFQREKAEDKIKAADAKGGEAGDKGHSPGLERAVTAALGLPVTMPSVTGRMLFLNENRSALTDKAHALESPDFSGGPANASNKKFAHVFNELVTKEYRNLPEATRVEYEKRAQTIKEQNQQELRQPLTATVMYE